MDDSNLERDLDRLEAALPEELRGDWCIVPRRFLVQVFLVGLCFGGSAALMVIAYTSGPRGLKWAWPVALVTLIVARRLLPWWRGDRFEAQLRARRSGDAPPAS